MIPFDQVEALEVGQTAERPRTIEGKYIKLFLEISGDRNPLHYDEAAAEASQSVRLSFKWHQQAWFLIPLLPMNYRFYEIS